MEEILLECMECKECYKGDNKSDGFSCPKCGGRISPLGYIEKHKEYVKETNIRLKSARRNGHIREGIEGQTIKTKYDETRTKLTGTTKKPLKVIIDIDLEEFNNKLKELTQAADRLKELQEELNNVGIRVSI